MSDVQSFSVILSTLIVYFITLSILSRDPLSLRLQVAPWHLLIVAVAIGIFYCLYGESNRLMLSCAFAVEEAVFLLILCFWPETRSKQIYEMSPVSSSRDDDWGMEQPRAGSLPTSRNVSMMRFGKTLPSKRGGGCGPPPPSPRNLFD